MSEVNTAIDVKAKKHPVHGYALHVHACNRTKETTISRHACYLCLVYDENKFTQLRTTRYNCCLKYYKEEAQAVVKTKGRKKTTTTKLTLSKGIHIYTFV